MNPNREGTQPGFELPAQPESLEGEDRAQEKGQEAPAARLEQAGKQVAAPILPVVPDDIPVADTPIIAVPVQDDQTGHPAAANDAQDTERIEMMWVDKAKAIINQTKNDPYQQKDEMSKVKAEYILKRFNKHVKTDEVSK